MSDRIITLNEESTGVHIRFTLEQKLHGNKAKDTRAHVHGAFPVDQIHAASRNVCFDCSDLNN